jgi:DNA-binding response OmpR family regulator
MARRVIFIADGQSDDLGTVGTLLGILLDHGATADLLSGGRASLLAVEPGRADLVVVDLDAPSFSGLSVFAEIGRVASRLPVVLLSREDSNTRRSWALEAGAVAYVTKPVDGAALFRYLVKVMDRAAAGAGALRRGAGG